MSNNDKFISLESLKKYNKQMKETYIKPLEERVDEIVTELTEDRATIEATYTNRVTADNRNIKDESDVILKKVVGNTISSSEGLKSATFSGIESKSQDGTKVDTFVFPKTEAPLGTTIDFENKTITNTYAEYTFTGEENWTIPGINAPAGFTRAYMYLPNADTSKPAYYTMLCDKFPVYINLENPNIIFASQVTLNETTVIFRIPNTTSFAIAIKNEEGITIDNEYVRNLTKGMTVRYPITPQIESFTTEQIDAGNSYKGYLKGTETVLNDGAEFGADNTLTQEYDISSINSRIDEIETDLKAMATRDWVIQYIKENFPTVIYVGAAEPTNETGNDGDLYMQTDSE